MTRGLYRLLLSIHPPNFRKQFSDEMLSIFDDAAALEGRAAFLADAVVSLARQWLIREGTWKVAVAALGGFLHISAVLGGLSAVLPR